MFGFYRSQLVALFFWLGVLNNDKTGTGKSCMGVTTGMTTNTVMYLCCLISSVLHLLVLDDYGVSASFLAATAVLAGLDND